MIIIRRGIYPGSFDPLTKGHLDIIKRASRIMDEVVVGVFINPNKTPTFSVEERVQFIKESTSEIPNIKVESFSGLLVDFMHKEDSNVIIRGLRAISDFEYELQSAIANRTQDRDIETIFLMTSAKYSYLSSSIVKDIARFGGNIEGYVPEILRERVMNKLYTQK